MSLARAKRNPLDIQKSVIGSLLMREIITRYGRNNIGFLWLFIEPLLLTLAILGLWSFSKANKVTSINIAAFMVTGYPMAMMWRNSAGRCVKAITVNTSLLYHRNVRVLDVFISRLLLEIAGASIAILCILVVFYFFGWIPAPADVMLMIYGWFLIAWFGVGLGLVIGVLSEWYELFGQFWKTLSFFLVPSSGALFFVDSLPLAAQKVVLWIPMVHGTEMFRHGYFGPSVRTHEDPMYLIVVNLVMLFAGLLLVQKYSKGVEPS